ncbi:MAG: hypothetical protein ACW976_04370 [Candidatus Ranarchaeia archaeon]|jgi:hypothetical protein
MFFDLKDVNLDIDGAAAKIMDGHGGIFEDVLKGLLTRNETLRHNCYKVLLKISEKDPERLYPKWDFFVDLLKEGTTSRKFMGVNIISNIIKVDAENKFEKIFETFYGLLNDKSVIPVSHVAGNSGKIIKAKPHLQSKITRKLLNIEQFSHDSKQKELVKAYVIDAFDEYYKDSEDKPKIMGFVQAQLASKSPKTQKKAKAFISKWSG